MKRPRQSKRAGSSSVFERRLKHFNIATAIALGAIGLPVFAEHSSGLGVLTGASAAAAFKTSSVTATLLP